MPARHRFKFTVIGRYRTHLRGNEPAVTISMASGRDEHLTYAGTLTMSEAEWDSFVDALRRGLKGDLEVEDHSAPSGQEKAAKI